MKLLFDENISYRIIKKIQDIFPESVQVDREGFKGKTDRSIWDYAKRNNFTIVTFDEDFFELVISRGFPPKVIWLRLGNTSTTNISQILINKVKEIKEFIKNDEYGCLEILDPNTL